MAGTVSLASSFYRTYRGPAGAEEAHAPLEAALVDFSTRGREEWPDVALEPAALAAYLGERAPVDTAPVAWLGEQRAGDLFLACACAEGLPQALTAFDAVFLGKVDHYLRTLRPTPELVAETTQELRAKLFVSTPGSPSKIRQYAGQGALAAWVRVAAVRTALNLREASKAGRPQKDEADELMRAIVPDGDPELELIRERYEDAFVAAFRDAIADLPRRDRTVLRFTFVEGLTPARIGMVYGVHRTTAMRWVDAAQAQVLAGTRSRMMDRLSLSRSECDGVIALLRSRIEITLTSLRQSTS